ncbi:MAG: ImuA family protein [Alphaproteobacteria bacterium]
MTAAEALRYALPGPLSPPAARLALGVPLLDEALGGGLERARLHELSSAHLWDAGATGGFALALAILSRAPHQHVVWVQQDFAGAELAQPYGLGAEFFGLPQSHLLFVRAAHARDVLWAMEECLRAQAIAAAIGELCEEGKAADLTATRRLSLAAQQGGGLALLLRQRVSPAPAAASTRWRVAAAAGAGDGFGGLGRVSFALSLLKNRRGPLGQWVLQWDHDAGKFTQSSAALSRGVAAAPVHRPAQTDLRQAV